MKAHFSAVKQKPLLPICQMSKSKEVQDNVLKLLAKSHQNPKSMNKVIAQLVKTSKSFFFHCDVTDDLSLCPKFMGESTGQTVSLA